MTDLTTTHLQHLLDRTTPGPWERHPENVRMLCNLERKFAVHAELAKRNGAEPEPEDVANTELIALAPQLAQEVINLRDALGYLVEETRIAAENSDDVVAQKRVADAIKTTVAKIQGDHDE